MILIEKSNFTLAKNVFHVSHTTFLLDCKLHHILLNTFSNERKWKIPKTLNLNS